VVPAEVMADSQDLRRLGVPVERIVLCGDDMRLDIAPDCLSLHEGFHDSEGSHRWTDGCGALPSQFLTGFFGETTIDIQVGGTGLHYPLASYTDPHTVQYPAALNIVERQGAALATFGTRRE